MKELCLSINERTLMISQRLTQINNALSIELNEIVYESKANGNDIITLSLGEAFFDLPKFDISELEFEKGYHYGESQGRKVLREKIAELYNNKYACSGLGCENFLITAGSKPAIYMCMLAVADQDDEVIIQEPGWLSYEHQARLAGLRVQFASFDKDIAEIPKLFSEKTKMVILNNPNNPAGVLYSKNSIIELYQSCVDAGIILLIDEAYSDFLIDGFSSARSYFAHTQNLIVVNSISKNFGMSGWRIGYVLADPETILQINKVNQHLITCAPTVLLDYVGKYFDEISEAVESQIVKVVKKRNDVRDYIEKLGLNSLGGEATFYLFLDVSSYSGSAMELCKLLLKSHHISVVPGEAYGRSTANYVRISVGTESISRICDAIDIIAKYLTIENRDD